jgi:hypothetical protein
MSSHMPPLIQHPVYRRSRSAKDGNLLDSSQQANMTTRRSKAQGTLTVTGIHKLTANDLLYDYTVDLRVITGHLLTTWKVCRRAAVRALISPVCPTLESLSIKSKSSYVTEPQHDTMTP